MPEPTPLGREATGHSCYVVHGHNPCPLTPQITEQELIVLPHLRVQAGWVPPHAKAEGAPDA